MRQSSRKVKFFEKPPDWSTRAGCRIRTAETCAKNIAMRGIGLDFGGSKIEGGIDHTRFQRIKVRAAGQLPCLLAFGKTLRGREMTSDALQKLHGKGLPESERENACTGLPSILALLVMFPQEQQSDVDDNNGDDSTGARRSQIPPFKTLAVAFTQALSGDVIYVSPGTCEHTTRAQRHW